MEEFSIVKQAGPVPPGIFRSWLRKIDIYVPTYFI
jgi:hypothetical protein